MSSIRNAFVTVKNFMVGLVNSNPHQGSDRDRNIVERRSYLTQLQNTIFSSRESRKRPASSTFDPEITDDEDDFHGTQCNTNTFHRYPILKRLRGECDSDVMTSRNAGGTSGRYKTRGSGQAPTIEGLAKQPWEFDFKTRRKDLTNQQCNNGASSHVDSGVLTAHNSTSASTICSSWLPQVSNRIKATSSAVCSRQEQCKAHERDNKLSIPFGNLPNGKCSSSAKNIEVITLDDDDDSTPTTSSLGTVGENSYTLSASKKELALTKPKVSTALKCNKNKDTNRLTRCLKQVGRKFLMPTTSSSAIRLEEMQDYKQLLSNYNIINFKDQPRAMFEQSRNLPMFRTKLSRDESEVMYKRFDSSPTKGSVSIHLQGLAKAMNDVNSSSPHPELLPKLYSTPKYPDFKLNVKTCTRTESKLPVTPIARVESKLFITEQCPTPSPGTSTKSYELPAHANLSVSGNYSNLKEALNKTTYSEESHSLAINDDTVCESSTEHQTPTDEDEDISIICEKIVNKSRNRSYNTLALEQTSCPYVEKRWLSNSISERKERQKQRENRIHEEAKTIDIIRSESTIEKELEERIRKKLVLTEIIVLEEPPAELPELTEDIINIIEHAKEIGVGNQVLAQVRLLKDTISITRGDIKTLGTLQWLNDNVINTYMGLIVLRSKLDDGEKWPRVYAFQTFFYPKLLKEGYSNSLKRWTRKDDIFAHDILILPIHLGMHWCLACIDFRKKTIRYYDSLNAKNDKCLDSLLEYISKEMKERKQKDLNKAEWTLENVKGIPQQRNGSDCGMFACKFAEYLSRDSKFTFKQENMPYFRDRMIYELIKQDLMHP